MREIFTVGHSNVPVEKFVELLTKNKIALVVDVRSYPGSKHFPWFDSAPLYKALNEKDISYTYLGQEMGGKPRDSHFYDTEGYVLYGKIVESKAFAEGVDILQERAERQRVAIMCSEEDPTECHRRLLVGKVLAKRGFEVWHIRGDGRLQTERNLTTEPPSVFGETAWRSAKPMRK